jgi:hypothetical protein
MSRNWKDDYQYDRKQDWLISAGRSGRLVSHITLPPEEVPDVKPPEIRTKQSNGVGPVIAVIATEAEPPLTRQEAIEQNGYNRGRR